MLIWLVIGLTVTSLSIVFESNIAILISMAFLIMPPIGVIVIKTVVRNISLAKILTRNKKSQLVLISSLGVHARKSRQERMRSEAIELQNELERINQITDHSIKLLRMGQWKIKADIHHQLYADIENHIDDYSDEIKLELGLMDNQSAECCCKLAQR
ncbi:hypothetical protein [Aliikangiella maris]